ncbi:MAG: LacI family DNA-binding transcriptional regulator [Betaproteobacteria bacterium]|nr:LacI family DNA-binding transcriptional regulator [Betaproteobacteria bacterium]
MKSRVKTQPSASPASTRKSRRAHGGVTLQDVARLAGVSPITASRAINQPDVVSEDARERVQRAIRQTGYTPNLLAGSLASSRSRLVAVVVPTLTGPMFMETIQALTERLAEVGYQVIIGQSGYDNAREDELLNAIIGRRPDGIVLTGVAHSAKGRVRLAGAGIPVVETWDFIPTPIDMLVGFSHDSIGPEVAAFLRQRGCKRVAVLSADDERAVRRAKSFAAAAHALRITAGKTANSSCEWLPALTSLGVGRRGFAALFERLPKLDGVFCSSDVVAQGVLAEAQARGLRVPEDLAVVGFGDLAFAPDLHPPLTTVRVDANEMGRIAGDLILKRVAGESVKTRLVDVGFSIVERGSA